MDQLLIPIAKTNLNE